MSEQNVYEVGSLWHTSWGYDQTNVDFFQVVRETKGTVTVRKLGAEVRGGRLFPLPGEFHGEWTKVCRKPRVDWAKEHPYLRISTCKTAWPTTADKGHYDTHAAGQPGH